MVWPNGANNAVMITVNLDAEYFAKPFVLDADLSEGASFEVMGRYGMEIGLPRLLDVLDQYYVKATFFVPGMVALKYPESIRKVLEKGHEIGCHGYEHENLALLSQERQREVIMLGRQAIEKICGVTPQGFRAPEGELTLKTLQLVKEEGFMYSSSLYEDDVPYYKELNNGKYLLEIPIHWALYDLPHFIFHFWPPVPSSQSRIAFSDDVFTNWKWEYDGFYKYGACYVLQLDPQIIGSQGKIYILDQLLSYIREKGSAWVATGIEIYNYYKLYAEKCD